MKLIHSLPRSGFVGCVACASPIDVGERRCDMQGPSADSPFDARRIIQLSLSADTLAAWRFIVLAQSLPLMTGSLITQGVGGFAPGVGRALSSEPEARLSDRPLKETDISEKEGCGLQ
jgi:hypothetical protein